MELRDGVVKLSGFSDAYFNCGWDEKVEGYVIQINGKNYGVYRDPDDGYRSYGCFFETDKPCKNTFPPQNVLLKTITTEGGYDWYEDPKTDGVIITNPETGELILNISTTWYDSYYPMGYCEFHPENLPINKNRK
jgi:hypothetical protein